MFILVTVLIMIAALVLALIVLVQNGKGGGLAANFASQNQVMGVRKTTDFLEKATWFLAGAMIVFCLLSSALIPKPRQTNQTLNGNNVPSVPAANSNSNAQGSNTAQPLNQKKKKKRIKRTKNYLSSFLFFMRLIGFSIV